VAIIAFDGMQSHRLAAPPMTSRSTSVTSAPRRAAWVAAWMPAGPPPTITKRTGIPPRVPAPRCRSARGLVDAEGLAEHVADLTQGGPGPESLLHGHEQVLRAPGGRAHVGQGGFGPGLVTLRPNPADPLGLVALQRGIDRKHLDGLDNLVDVAVDADDHLLAVVDGLGVGVRSLLDLVLHESCLDGLNGTAHPVDLLEVVPCARFHRVGEGLDEVRAGQRVHG